MHILTSGFFTMPFLLIFEQKRLNTADAYARGKEKPANAFISGAYGICFLAGYYEKDADFIKSIQHNSC